LKEEPRFIAGLLVVDAQHLMTPQSSADRRRAVEYQSLALPRYAREFAEHGACPSHPEGGLLSLLPCALPFHRPGCGARNAAG